MQDTVFFKRVGAYSPRLDFDQSMSSNLISASKSVRMSTVLVVPARQRLDCSRRGSNRAGDMRIAGSKERKLAQCDIACIRKSSVVSCSVRVVRVAKEQF